MQSVASIVQAIGAFNGLMGRIFSVVALAIVLICFTVVVLRYGFSIGSIPLQDLYVWLNGTMFMGIAGFALLRDAHVRVDVFYRDMPVRRKALVDMFGCVVFVAPFVTVLVWYGFVYVARSWGLHEGSANVGGLPGLYVVKSFILVFAAVIGLQALAMFLRGLLVLADCEAFLPPDLRYRTDEA